MGSNPFTDILDRSGVKVTEASILPTFYARFFRKYFGAKKFQTKNKILYEKGVRKMLMKLTPGLIDPPSLVLPRCFKCLLTNCVLGNKTDL